nr:RNA pseudouridine synthase [Parachlamydiaceae bacterium]
LFKQRKVKKTYLAIVDGLPKSSQGIIDNFLGKISIYEGQTLYGEVSKAKGGLSARTVWKKEKTGVAASFIICYPETGRTHQLRVHLSGLGHPILGDYQYGRSFKCSFRPQRMLLHAYEITFENPVTNQLIQVIAKQPADFVEAIIFLIDQRSA